MAADSKTASLGKYRNLEKVGEGGFAVVYKALDPGLDRTVAIKVLKGELSGSADALKRFHLEARLAAGLRHPNIVTVLEVGEEAGRYFIVMDYLPGPTLAEKMKAGRLALWEVVKLLKPLASALDYAHAQGVVHRDVKPANILFNAQGEPVLTDFGLVKSLADAGVSTTGMTLGTTYYMAPEQIRNQEVGAYTDQYSLGVVTYEMLAGKVPFDGKSPFDVQLGHVSKELPDILRINRSLPEAVKSLVERSLAKESKDRFKSCLAFAAELEEIFAQNHSQLVKQFISDAEDALSRKWFAKALDFLKSAQELDPSQYVKNHLEVVQRRREIYNNYKKLKAEISKMQADEPWLMDSANLKKSRKESLRISQKKVLLDELGFEWVEIPAGEFLFGENNVMRRIEKSFSISKYPVTNAQYYLYVHSNPDIGVPPGWDAENRMYPEGKENHPVVLPTWRDAQRFCKCVGCRLPTEEEWEKAARGTNGRLYPWGVGWKSGRYCNTNQGDTTPVGRYSGGVSPYGVWDMSGNVWEWTGTKEEDCYIVKGGSYRNFGNPRAVRSANRKKGTSGFRQREPIGFRVCLVDKKEE